MACNPGFTSSSYSYSCGLEDYIDSDDEGARSSFAYRQPQPAKLKTQKPVKTQGQKAKSRDDYVEKVEFFCCKICKKQYSSKASLNRHFTTAHGLEKDVKEAKKPKPVYGLEKDVKEVKKSKPVYGLEKDMKEVKKPKPVYGLEKDVKEAKKQKPANAVSKALNTW